MAKVAELTTNGELKITGNVNSREPVIKDGLVMHFPFDNTVKGIEINNSRNLVPYQNWIIGTSGSQPFFSERGEGNSIIEHEDPYGSLAAVWQCLGNDPESNADGGWDTSYFPIDNTKTYRFSVWVRRNVVGNGRFYFGCAGGGGGSGLIRNDDGTTLDTNAYFTNTEWTNLPVGEWILVVGFVFPYNYEETGLHKDSGYYTKDGVKIRNTHYDYRWRDVTTTAAHHAYLYYSTDPTTEQLFAYPRVDLVDGSEPSIEDLINGINGEGNVVNPTSNSNTIKTFNGLYLHREIENISPLSSFFDECEGIHIGDPSVSNSTQINIGGNWRVATHYNNAVFQIVEDITPYGWGKIARWICRDMTGWKAIHSYNIINLEAGKTYTFSVWVRVNTGISGNPSAHAFHGPEGYRYHFQWEKNPAEYPNEWIRGTRTITPDTDVTGSTYLYAMTNAKNGTIIDYWGFQIEENYFANYSIKNGTSQSPSDFKISGIGGLTEYSIFGKFIPMTPFKDSENGYSDTTKASSILMKLVDKTNDGNVYYKYWMSNNSTVSAPYLDPNGSYGTSHIHKNYKIDANEPAYYVFRKSTNELKFKIFQNGGWKDEYILPISNPAALDEIVISGSYIWNCLHQSLSVYNRTLTDDELNLLVKSNTFNLAANGDLNNSINSSEMIGWIKVFEGLVTETWSTELYEGEKLDIYGDNIQFNQMMIKAKHWDHYVIADTTETAVLKNSFKWYVQWLFEQDDSTNPQILFHGTDGVQDVGFTIPNIMLYSYDNSWRKFTNVFYVNDTDEGYMFLGNLPSEINKEDWQEYYGYSHIDYCSYMRENYPKESGIYQLTPRMFQEIEVYARMKPNKTPYMEIQKNVKINKISTKEVI